MDQDFETQFAGAIARHLASVPVMSSHAPRVRAHGFVGATFTEALVKSHTQVVTKVSTRLQKNANKYAKRLLPLAGQVDFASDAIGTIKCTTNCVAK